MKNAKKLISFMLCMVMILALSATAFAENSEQGTRAPRKAIANGDFDLLYDRTHHYVPYDTVVGRYVYYPAPGDATPKATYVKYIQGGLFDYSDTNGYTNMNPCINGNTIDGVFGQLTESCVRAFQTHCGVSSDGIVGNNTWGKLENCLNAIN